MKTAAAAAALILLSAVPALADHWSATNVRGTALILIDDKWQDIAVGQVLPAAAVVRTLENGQLTLVSAGIGIGLGGDAAVQIVEVSGGVALTHYAGTLDVQAQASAQVMVETPNGKVTFSAGSVRTVVSEDRTRVVVTSGRAQIADATGHAIDVAAGEAADVTIAGTTLEEPAALPAESPADTPLGNKPLAAPSSSSAGTPLGTDPASPPGGGGRPSSPGGGGGPSPGGAGGPPDAGEHAPAAAAHAGRGN